MLSVYTPPLLQAYTYPHTSWLYPAFFIPTLIFYPLFEYFYHPFFHHQMLFCHLSLYMSICWFSLSPFCVSCICVHPHALPLNFFSFSRLVLFLAIKKENKTHISIFLFVLCNYFAIQDFLGKRFSYLFPFSFTSSLILFSSFLTNLDPVSLFGSESDWSWWLDRSIEWSRKNKGRKWCAQLYDMLEEIVEE